MWGFFVIESRCYFSLLIKLSSLQYTTTNELSPGACIKYICFTASDVSYVSVTGYIALLFLCTVSKTSKYATVAA